MSLVAQLIKAKDLLEEGVRQYTICNACRYCEGYCPVWPMMARRTVISKGDVIYLANLCFDHRDCFYACPYAPPHEFNINIPGLNREVRLWTYSQLTFNITKTSIGKAVLALIIAIPLIGLWWLYLPNVLRGYPLVSFYNIVPKYVIIVSGFAVLAYLIGWVLWFIYKFNKLIGPNYKPRITALPGTVVDILRHKWFGDIHYPSEYENNLRLVYHLLIFYGFIMDFISTILGAIYEDVFHILSPFPLLSPVVITGLSGGLMIVVGTVMALIARYISINKQKFMNIGVVDLSLTITLLLTALTGLTVLSTRLLDDYAAMYITLLIHYSLVYILFVIMPLTSTIPHIILRTYAYWIYKSAEKEH